MLDAETGLAADEALEHGVCDVVEEANQAAALVDDKIMKQYKNVPGQLLQPSASTTEMSEEEKALREKILADSKANLTYLNTIL